MKKGTYIDYNIVLACLSQKRIKGNREVNQPKPSVETGTDNTILFEK